MDTLLLAEAVRIFLVPALPYLMGLGGKVAEEPPKETGKAGVKKVWEKLQPKVEDMEGAREAAEDLAADPEDPDAQAALRLQLKKLLAADEDLAGEVARSWRKPGSCTTPSSPAAGPSARARTSPWRESAGWPPMAACTAPRSSPGTSRAGSTSARPLSPGPTRVPMPSAPHI